MTPRTNMMSRAALLLGSAAIIAVLPMRSGWNGHVPTLSSIAAMAKGGDNSGSGSSGSGGSGDDSSGHDTSDDDSDQNSGSDDGPDHDLNDDNGGSAGASGTVVKIEVTGTHIEVRYADGTKEEITGGRYERKNAAGRTVEERAATQADFDRLNALR